MSATLVTTTVARPRKRARLTPKGPNIWMSFQSAGHDWHVSIHHFQSPAEFIRAIKFRASNELPFVIRAMNR